MVFIEDILVNYKSTKKLLVGAATLYHQDIRLKLSSGVIFKVNSIDDLRGIDVVGIIFSFEVYLVTYNKEEQLLYKLLKAGYVNYDEGHVSNGLFLYNTEFSNIFEACRNGKLKFENMSGEFGTELAKYLMMG